MVSGGRALLIVWCLKSLTRPPGSFPPPPGIRNQARSRDDRRKRLFEEERKTALPRGDVGGGRVVEREKRHILTPFLKTCCNQEKNTTKTSHRLEGSHHSYSEGHRAVCAWTGIHTLFYVWAEMARRQRPLGLLPRTLSFAWRVISSFSMGKLYYFLPAAHQRWNLDFMLDALSHTLE